MRAKKEPFLYPWEEEEKKKTDHKFNKKVWVVLFITWSLCLVPIPFTSIPALVMNLAALIMAIIVLTRGYVRQGIFLLLSIFILTPAFYFLGILLFATMITKSLDPANLSQEALKNTVQESINRELDDLYGITKKDAVPEEQKEEQFNLGKIFSKQPQETEKEPIKITNKYLVYTMDGGKISCDEVKLERGLLMMKTKSGVSIELEQNKIEKIERYQTTPGKTKVSVWRPYNR
jgi:hypothetical protein